MKERFPLIIFLLIACNCMGQKQGNIWYFGKHVGLDFNSGSPNVITNGAITLDSAYQYNEGTSTMCDKDGNLLFYTDGQFVWNSQHQVMPNGKGLKGHFSSTQSCLIVPQPCNKNIYYVFTTDAFQNNLTNGLSYSMVNIYLDGGKGDIISNKKNIKLLDSSCEKLTAIRHANKKDFWIISHGYNSDKFYAFLLTDQGITDTVISSVGSKHANVCGNPTNTRSAAIGTLKPSPNGKKLIILNGLGCNNISEVLDFDKNTGAVSNVLDLNIGTNGAASYFYGACFSPDNTKLYISTMAQDRVLQFDLSLGSNAAIAASKSVIATTNSAYFGNMQLGPDGIIYIARYNKSYLSTIADPNNVPSLCKFTDMGCSLNGSISSLGLTNILSYSDFPGPTDSCQPFKDTINIASFGVDTQSGCVPHTCVFKNSSKDATNFFWDFGDGTNSTLTSPTHVYNTAGTYTALLYSYDSIGTKNIDTVSTYINVWELPIADFNYTFDSCLNKIYYKYTGSGAATYQWQFGDGSYDTVCNPNHLYDSVKKYTVTLQVQNKYLCSDSQSLVVDLQAKPKPKVQMQYTQTISSGCIPLPVTFSNNSLGSNSFIWDFGDGNSISDNSKTINYTYTQAGQYQIKLISTDTSGCKNQDSIYSNIEVLSGIKADFHYSIDSCTSQVNFEDLSSKNVIWDWDMGDKSAHQKTQNPNHSFSKDDLYTIKLRVSYSNCYDSMVQQINIQKANKQLYFPGAFSPNNDGLNDRFEYLGNIICIKDFAIEIYNRWGEQVFNSNNMYETWDGNAMNHTPCPEGIYQYHIHTRGRDYYGRVTLIH